jgi:hypothetical protein
VDTSPEPGLGWRLAHLPALLAATGVLLAGAAALGWLARGGVGAAGAALGAGLVAAGYLASTLVVGWADATRPALVLPVALGSYVVKVGLVGAALGTASASGWPGLLPMVFGVVAGAVAWPAALVWWARRAGHLARSRPRGPIP